LASVLKQRVEFGIRDLQESRRSQARVSKALGEFIEDLSRSIELDPSLIEAYVIKAAILRDRQEFGEARDVLSDGIKVMEPVLKSKPKSLEVREKLAKLYATRSLMQEETDDQIADMEKSYEINPNDADILKRYLLLLQSQQKFDKVLQTLEKALASEPDNIEFIASKITILLQSGKIDDALAFSTKRI
jgi:tetratricopeptide (TPR) repeat protein